MNNLFTEERDALLAQFEKGMNVVLSTSAQDIVTSRTVTVIPFQNALYLTSIRRVGAMKIEQIEKNQNVALCANTMQITGSATIVGLVSAEENKTLAALYQEKLPESYERFASVPSAVFIKIDVKTYKNWKLVSGKVEVTAIDFSKQTVSRNII